MDTATSMWNLRRNSINTNKETLLQFDISVSLHFSCLDSIVAMDSVPENLGSADCPISIVADHNVHIGFTVASRRVQL